MLEVALSSKTDETKRMSSKASSSASKKKGAAGKSAQAADESTEDEPVLDGSMRDDILGVVLAVVGIVLFVAVILPSDAPVTSAVSQGLKLVFGLGAYIIPFAFVLWGASYFLKTTQTHIGRQIAGVALILVAVMSLLSLFNGGVNPEDADSLLEEGVLVGGGGYVGSGVSWVLMGAMGRVIACIILVAVIVVGLVLAGVPVSAPFLFVKNFIAVKREEKAADEEYEASARFAEGNYCEGEPDFDDPRYMPDSDTTILYGAEGRTPLTGMEGGGEEEDDGDGGADATVDLSRERSEAGPAHETLVLAPSSETVSRRKRKKASREEAASAVTQALPKREAAESDDAFHLPDPGVLSVSGRRKGAGSGELRQTAKRLQQTLEEFNLPATVVGWLAGPTVTMFKVELPSGVRLQRLVSLADDIALSLASPGVRIAQIPNTSLVGVEIPNKTRANVLLGDVFPYAGKEPLQMAIGEDVDGNKICLDLAKMPHLLVGGTTGSGKSVALNSMIMTILMRTTPAEVRMILIDPKRVEFSLYNGVPHLLVPPVTEPKEAASSLRWAVAEMERRLKLFESVGARNIDLYNKMIADGSLTDDNGDCPEKLPYIVIVIDELSDLMMVAGKDVEDSIVRISQLARAAGIHLIVATQRPSANVVTGMIKANITNRIALTVSQGLESRVIIDQAGAEKLTGHGDMLFSRPEWGKPKRIQGCFVSEAEISSVVEELKAQGSPEYHTEILKTQLSESGSGGKGDSGGESEDDPLIWEAADAVVAAGLGSTSMLQRRLKVGYARAGRIMDMLEAKGIVGPQDGSHAREVLVDSVEDLEAIRAFEENDEEDER